jgi:hypothetical protein
VSPHYEQTIVSMKMHDRKHRHCSVMSHPVLRPNQMLIVCMPRIKLSYIRSECKHRIPMSLL